MLAAAAAAVPPPVDEPHEAWHETMTVRRRPDTADTGRDMGGLGRLRFVVGNASCRDPPPRRPRRRRTTASPPARRAHGEPARATAAKAAGCFAAP